MSKTDVTAASMFECPAGRWWVCALLGVILLAGGIFVLWNAVAASIVTAIFFAAAMIATGVFQIVHGFAARGWGSLILSVLVGVLFAIGGVLLLGNPLATSLGITLAIAAMLIVSGVLRLWMAVRHWGDFGWILLASGLFAIALGAILIQGFPVTGLVVPGVLLGVDMIIHGVWWLVLGFFVRRPHGGAGMAHSHA